MSAANIIYQQIGGNRFAAMTGSHHFLADGNTLRMQLVKNKSKANRLYITYDEVLDLYNMRFFRETIGRLNYKTGMWIEGKVVEVEKIEGVYCDMLEDVFERVTGLYTHL